MLVGLGDGVAVGVAHVDDAGASGQQLADDDATFLLVDDLQLDREHLALEADETRQGGTGANADIRREEYGVEALERRHRPSRTTSKGRGGTRHHPGGHGVGGEECGKAVGVDHVKMSGERRP